MPTFKICVFKHHQRNDGKYRVSIRVTHSRTSAYIKTDVFVLPKQISKDFTSLRDLEIVRRIDREIIDYERILLRELGSNVNNYTAKELISFIQTYRTTDGGAKIDFIAFTSDYTAKLKASGHTGVAGSFSAVKRHLIDFFGRDTVFVRDINVKNLQGFIAYLQKPRIITRVNQHGSNVTTKKQGCKDQTIKDYITDIQTLFNKICYKYNGEDAASILISHNPFIGKKLQITVREAPAKRDLSIEDLIKILTTTSLPSKRMQTARDVLALSFYLQAMNTADIYGEDAQLSIRRVNYHRQKTAPRRKDEAFISVKITPEVLPLMRKYRDPKKKRLFVFSSMYSSFCTFNQNINKGCKMLAEYLGIESNLTTYCMRHTLATIAAEDCGISDADIGLLLNHNSAYGDIKHGRSLKVTQGYIHRRFTKNDANQRKILDFANEEIGKKADTSSNKN